MRKLFLFLILFAASPVLAINLTPSGGVSGLGTMAYQDSASVNITGGSISVPSINATSGLYVNSSSEGILQLLDASSQPKVTLTASGNSVVSGNFSANDLRQSTYHRFYHLDNVSNVNLLIADLSENNSAIVVVVNTLTSNFGYYGYFRSWVAVRNYSGWILDGSGSNDIQVLYGGPSAPYINFVGSGLSQTLNISNLGSGGVNLEVIVSCFQGALVTWL